MTTPISDGSRVVVHTIRRGENLTSIAKDYGLGSYEPIWVYNTKVHRNLPGADANFVPAGRKILIPRSKAGYDRLIKRLELLKTTAVADADQVRSRLEGQYNQHQGERVVFNFLGDVFTLVAGTAQKVYSYTSKYAMANKAAGETGVRLYEAALKEEKLLRTELGRKLLDTTVEKGLGLVDPDLEKGYKDLYRTQKKGIEAIRRAGTSLLDVADIVLDYVNVSNVADTLIALAATEVAFGEEGVSVKRGETPEETYRGALRRLERTVQRTCDNLDGKIARYRREMRLVHAGPSPRSAPTAI